MPLDRRIVRNVPRGELLDFLDILFEILTVFLICTNMNVPRIFSVKEPLPWLLSTVRVCPIVKLCNCASKFLKTKVT